MNDIDNKLLELGILISKKKDLESKLGGIFSHKTYYIYHNESVISNTQVIDIGSQDVIDILNKKIQKITSEINVIKEQLKLSNGEMG